jgi:hypothetical protein
MVDLSFPAPAALIAHCRPAQRSQNITPTGGRDSNDVANLVDWLNAKDEFGDHDTWVNLGMALRLEYGDAGLDIWRRAHDESVTEGVEASKWKSFETIQKPGCYTLNSLLKRAHDLGWTGTIRPSAASMFAGMARLTVDAPMPLPEGVPGPSNPAAEENEANEAAHPTPAGGFTKTLAQSLAGFTPPDYLVDGILQRRFCYSLTAQTGVGKTTVAMRLAAHVAIGKPLGEIGIERGSVLYFAGENPTDVQMRWLGLCKEMNLDPVTLDIHVVEGSMHLSKVSERITQEVHAVGKPMALVVVDTAAAYFEEDNDNDNVQAGNHARRLRSLCGLPGGPCVVILCHPTKNAQDDNLVPRGGGAFLNEVDGNIALRRDGDTIVAFALGKFRGPEFTPINFGLKVIRNHPLLVDTKGRPIPTIIAEPISAAEHQRMEERMRTNEDKILEALCNQPGLKQADIAKVTGIGASTVSRAMPNLVDANHAECDRGYWTATPKGQKSLNVVARSAAAPVQPLTTLTPANLGPAGIPTPHRPGTPPPMPPVPG